MVLLWWWCFCELRCSTTMDGAIDATSASVYWWCVAVLLYWWMTRRRQDGVADATPASTATTTPLSHSGTPYENGLFRMKLLLCRDFPHSPPKGFFLTKIFHPNIATSGEICVNTLKRDWSPSLGLRYVLLVVRCLLIEPFPESALNEQAGKMLLENYEEYARLARLYIGIHAHKHKNKSKTGAICESTTSLNAGQSNETVLSKNTALAPALSSTSTSTKVLGLHDQNAAPSDPAVGGASAAHKKDGLLAVKIPVEKKKIDARKKGLKRL